MKAFLLVLCLCLIIISIDASWGKVWKVAKVFLGDEEIEKVVNKLRAMDEDKYDNFMDELAESLSQDMDESEVDKVLHQLDEKLRGNLNEEMLW